VQRFSPTDRRRLERALPVVREARLYRRIGAVLLVAEGQPVSEAARRVRATRLGVRGWVERYLATHDAAALADRPRRGRPHSAPRLTPCRLAAALARDPRGCGYQATSWTVPLLGQYPHRRHGITVGARTPRRRLHGLDHWSKRLPLEAAPPRLRRAGGAPGPEKGGIARRLRAGWRAGDVLLCCDWTLLRLFPPLRAAWARRGTQASVPITGANAKRVLFGAIDLRTAHRVVLIRPRAGAADAQAFLRGLDHWSKPAPLPRRRHDLAAGRPGQRAHRRAHPDAGRGARHPAPLAAQAGAGTERHGPSLARAEAAHRRQSAGHLGGCSGPRCRGLGAGTDTPAGAPQGRDGFEALLAQEPGRRLMATYLAMRSR
jgi:transposase